MSNLKIRRARREDMDTIAGFIRSSADWYKPFIAEKDLSEHEVDDKWKDENYGRRDFYIGEDPNNNEVGTISMQYFGEHTYLGYIYLDTDHVGKGYGRRLIDFAREQSKVKKQESMVLISHPEANWAVKAYEKYGFKRIHTKKEEIIKYNNGMLEPYYEEGFHLYEYKLNT